MAGAEGWQEIRGKQPGQMAGCCSVRRGKRAASQKALSKVTAALPVRRGESARAWEPARVGSGQL